MGHPVDGVLYTDDRHSHVSILVLSEHMFCVLLFDCIRKRILKRNILGDKGFDLWK